MDGSPRERGVGCGEFEDYGCETEGPETLCGGCLWDPYHDYEQMEALMHGGRSTCQLGFEKVLFKNRQVETAESEIADNQYKLVFCLFTSGYFGVSGAQWLSSLG